jgi:hypothetical protein
VIIAVALLITAVVGVVELAKLGSLEQRLLGAATAAQEHLTTVALTLEVAAVELLVLERQQRAVVE